jgi:predicted nucleic acid-binding protein
METVIADTGFVVALANRLDAKHEAVKAIYLQQQKILLPQTVLAEVAYLIGREAGVITVASFLKGLPMSRFSLLALLDEDILRVAEILDRYAFSCFCTVFGKLT